MPPNPMRRAMKPSFRRHACDIAAVLKLDHVDDLMPVVPRSDVEDRDLFKVSDDSLSSRSRVQLNEMIVNAVATAKAKP